MRISKTTSYRYLPIRIKVPSKEHRFEDDKLSCFRHWSFNRLHQQSDGLASRDWSVPIAPSPTCITLYQIAFGWSDAPPELANHLGKIQKHVIRQFSWKEDANHGGLISTLNCPISSNFICNCFDTVSN